MNEKEAVEILKYDISAGEYSTTKTEVLETVLNLLEKQRKIIDSMAGEIVEYNLMLDDSNIFQNEEEVKKYFQMK